MTKSTRDRKSPATRDSKARKQAGEIKDSHLDKVVGGLKSTGGTRTKGGDPCDGGE